MISTGAGREDTVANVIQQEAGRGKGGASGKRDEENEKRDPRAALLSAPRSISLGLLALYLAATLGVLATSSATRLIAIHILLLGIVAWTIKPRSVVAAMVGDLLPLVVAPLLYAEIPSMISAIGSVYHDATIQQIELAVFGMQASQRFAAAFPNVAVSELLHAGYLSYYPAIFVPPLMLYVRGERRAYAETVVALTATYLICWGIFAFAPVEGPRYLWGASASAPNGMMRRLANDVLAAGSSRGAAFPSSHMAVVTAQTIMAFRWQRSVGWVLTVLALLVGLGAVYGGFHYATDMLAGAVLGAGIACVTLFAFSKARGTPSS
jgi:membrane-associated phospholipid phosphatase